MTRRMLVDATHPEEIRVAIVQDNRLVDLDIETANKEQIKGNIYLGRVSRVEPSLQAAFIEFHGGRQGFLSVNDIHPKYFTPGGLTGAGAAAREASATSALQAAVAADAADGDESIDFSVDEARRETEAVDPSSPGDGAESSAESSLDVMDFSEASASGREQDDGLEAESEEALEEEDDSGDEDAAADVGHATGQDDPEGDVSELESESERDEEEDRPPLEEIRRQHRRRPPPIQKILHRNQTVLVQVVKESRGNKGATLTTNLSLAGRYTVLLPENPGGGGISRKITDPAERKNLKGILNTLPISPEMSLIIRTAGVQRNKREFSRDISYLMRLWKMILEGTRTRKAPCLIHQEGDLIIRTIRDLYTTDMEEILIEGQEGYRLGKDFMRLLMPRYVKVVQPYRESIPLFARFQVESQIETMHDRVVQLKAGSYLVIDPTEALVTIDINSGRSTREKDVESTAFKTNLQAVDEIARQLRLRDLGGLVVIDFIDMEDRKHIQEVEKRVKEAFKSDRAKVQIGRISQFGLLELSRQRLRPTFSETNRMECPRCKGLGTIRSVESAAVYTYRCIEEEVAQGKYQVYNYHVSSEVMNYLFNHKRSPLVRLEESNQVSINIHADLRLQPPEFNTSHVEKSKKERERTRDEKVKSPPVVEDALDVEKKADPVVVARDSGTAVASDTGEGAKKKRRRKRRRKKNQGGSETGSLVQDAGLGSAPSRFPDASSRSEVEDDATGQREEEVVSGPQSRERPQEKQIQDMRHVEALAMRFPGLYTLHEVTPGTTERASSPLPEEDEEEDLQDRDLGPHAHESDMANPARTDAAAKRKRSRRGGRGRGRGRGKPVTGNGSREGIEERREGDGEDDRPSSATVPSREGNGAGREEERSVTSGDDSVGTT
ncbi:MAG: Rne/Rng family ribonuclease [Magnetococcales bacterium]|nr:Rne/Rng family ribonuclease [Magnetococcales bacterium]